MRYKAALIAEGTIAAYTDISCNGLSKYFYAKNISYDFLRLSFYIWMYKSNIIITGNDVT